MTGPLIADSSPEKRVPAPAPLSYAQQRLWLLDQIDPGKPQANMPRAFRIRGWLDVEALGRALGKIGERHEILHSVFRSIDGILTQTVVASAADLLPVVDLSAHAGPVREAEVLRLAEEEAQTPFDLTRGPMLRTKLLRLSIEEHVLLVTSHQIAFDERSSEIFDHELDALYEANLEGRSSPLPPLPLQYREFSTWQAEFLRGGAFEEQLAYWKHQLQKAPLTLDLPASRRRPQESTFRGATETALFSQELFEAIRAVGESEGASLFVTLLAAFQVLLLRHSGRSDFAVGSPVTGRRRAEFEGLIGMFANNLVFRADLSGDPSFRELLGRVRQVVAEADAHQDVPFEKLVEELNPERTLSHPPLFQVMMALQPASRTPLRLTGLSVTPLAVTAEIARYELALCFASEGEQASASLQYKTDLFQPRTIRRLLAHMEVLLRGIVEDPNRRLSQLPLMAPGERQQVLVAWNQTAVEYPDGVTVTRLFEEQAERTPDAVAVELQGRSLTYSELNQRSNRLARYLRRVGVGAGALVGVSVQRSLDMVPALLGVLKAGGAYVPLDPAYPAERLGHMIRDSGAAVVLADRKAAASLPKTSARLLLLDDLWKQIAAESGETAPADMTSQNLAYVIYTSGSTGTPKGVEIEHRALANYTQYAGDLFALRAEDRVLQFASLSFDVAAEEIFATLARGATLVLRTDEMIASVEDFLAACREQRVTVLDLPTSYWHELAAVAFAEGLRLPEPLRLVILGGEKALPERLAQWREIAGAGRVRLLNGYGPSEATIAATFWEVDEQAPSNLATVPIGRPVANARIYVLDESLEPVPIGVVGELYIGGVGLARGYRNRPDLTAEAFVPDPFHPNERLYRSGDRARYGPEGNLEYMGRIDEQIKVRGFRIEPGEVETALRAHPAVREVVVVSSGEGERRRLVAYLVADPGGAPAARDLRALLKKTLPEFMIPSKFVALDALPLTPSGKVDRMALPEMNTDGSRLERGYAAPQDIVEIKLARLWEQVLNVERVGTRDDFFELGGHSLLAVRLLSQVEKAFDRRLPLTVIFDAPTVGQLAALLQKEGWSPSWDSLVLIQAGSSPPPFYFVHALGGNVLSYKDLARRLGSDLPVYGLQAQGLDGKQPPHRRIEDMAVHYVRAIRQLQPEGPYLLGGLSFGGTVAFEMARQLHAAGQRVPLVVLMDTDNFPPPPPGDPPTVARSLGRFFGRLRVHLAELTRLAPGARLPYFREKMTTAFTWLRQNLAKRFEAARHPLPEAIRIVNAANQEAADRYVAQPYDGRVILFRSSERNLTPPDDPSLGWAAVCRGGLEIIEVEGGHEDIIYEPRVHVLAGELAARLSALDVADDDVRPREKTGTRRSP
jgi:amino acid adenylation domain-containing protein